MKDDVCVVEVGVHPRPYWVDVNGHVDGPVCSRHRSQFEERADEFGPFDWRRGHVFEDGLSQRRLVLVIGERRGASGVPHRAFGGCDRLAEVYPEYDCASCSSCGWQARISGAWFMDLWSARPISGDTGATT